MTARQIASVVTAASSSACPLPRYAICSGGKCQHIDPARACFLQNTGTFIDRGSCCIDVIPCRSEIDTKERLPKSV